MGKSHHSAVVEAIDPFKMAFNIRHIYGVSQPSYAVDVHMVVFYPHCSCSCLANLLGVTYNSGDLLRTKQQFSVVVEAINPSKMFSLSISNTYDI